MVSYDRLQLSKGTKVALLTLSGLEIFFALCAIGLAIPQIILSWWSYYDCYLEAKYGAGPYASHCNLYVNLNKFSMTAQGIWTGCFVIIAASFTIDFSVNPTKKMGSISNGFTSLCIAMSITMIVLDVLAAVDYEHMTHNENDNWVWSLHCCSLAAGCCLFALTLSSMILLSFLCCCGMAKVNTDYQTAEMPMIPNPPNYGIGVPYVVAPPTQVQYVAQPYQPDVAVPENTGEKF